MAGRPVTEEPKSGEASSSSPLRRCLCHCVCRPGHVRAPHRPGDGGRLDALRRSRQPSVLERWTRNPDPTVLLDRSRRSGCGRRSDRVDRIGDVHRERRRRELWHAGGPDRVRGGARCVSHRDRQRSWFHDLRSVVDHRSEHHRHRYVERRDLRLEFLEHHAIERSCLLRGRTDPRGGGPRYPAVWCDEPGGERVRARSQLGGRCLPRRRHDRRADHRQRAVLERASVHARGTGHRCPVRRKYGRVERLARQRGFGPPVLPGCREQPRDRQRALSQRRSRHRQPGGHRAAHHRQQRLPQRHSGYQP